MSSAITKKENFTLEPKTLEEAMKYADIMSKSSVVPKHYQGKPGDILVAVQMGAEVGLKPIQALQNIAVINGKPSIYGDACLALVKNHPAFEDIKEWYDDKTGTAHCEIKRKGQSWHKTSFSSEDAKKANLLGKAGPWTQYEKRMKQMRARGFNVRDTFPDALQGLILREEAEDYPMQNITPTQDERREVRMSATERLLQEIKPQVYEEERSPEPTPQEQLSLLIEENGIAESTYNKWLSMEGVGSINDFNDEQAIKYIHAIQKKYKLSALEEKEDEGGKDG